MVAACPPTKSRGVCTATKPTTDIVPTVIVSYVLWGHPQIQLFFLFLGSWELGVDYIRKWSSQCLRLRFFYWKDPALCLIASYGGGRGSLLKEAALPEKQIIRRRGGEEAPLLGDLIYLI